MTEGDPVLRRLQRDACRSCAAMVILALVARGGRPDVALGVLAGGVLIGLSYWAIKSAIDAMLAATARRLDAARRPSIAWPMAKLAGRYALLIFGAYVMIARLRLHPIGLLAGASSMVAAAAIEAVRTARLNTSGGG